MITQDGTIDATQTLSLVNADEVITEIIDVEVREFAEKPVLLSDGKPLLENGRPLMYRECIGKRIAHIQKILPMDAYAKGMALLRGGLSESGIPTEEQMNTMGDILLSIWTISEPWMSRDRLLRGGINGDKVFELYTLFFT